MRRLFAIIGIVSALGAAMPAAAAAAPPSACTMSVDPSAGSTTDTYRINGRHFPAMPDGSSLEVQVTIHRVGGHRKTILFVFLIPGGHHFYVDYQNQVPGEKNPPLAPGRYRVRYTTPHLEGCLGHTEFRVKDRA